MRGFVVSALIGIVALGFLAITLATTPVIAQERATPPPTNTPRNQPSPTPTFTASPTLSPTATLTPTTTQTLPPNPTVFYPPEFTPVPQGTAIPTAMPRLRPRDAEGNAYDVLNILLIGQDNESLQVDDIIRTDSMQVVHINLSTGTVSMLPLPRDLLVWISGLGMQRLNLAWGYGEAVGWTDGGWGALRQAVLYNFGIELHYFAMVDFTGFKTVIDRLDGITVAVDCPIEGPLFTGEYDENDEPIFDEDHRVDVGVHLMDSTEALWYARIRGGSSDFDRGRRQQQILRAVWAQSKNIGIITEIPELWTQINDIMDTNVPLDVMLRLIPLALSIEPNQIENHFFRLGQETVPWTTLDGENVQVPNPDQTMLALIANFLTPPTENRLIQDAAAIRIYDGSGNGAQWDAVAAERLLWEGLLGIATGTADEIFPETVVIDYSGESKGSSRDELLRVLNVKPDNYRVQPDPNSTVDFDVFLGQDYNSCFDRQVSQ